MRQRVEIETQSSVTLHLLAGVSTRRPVVFAVPGLKAEAYCRNVAAHLKGARPTSFDACRGRLVCVMPTPAAASLSIEEVFIFTDDIA